MTLDLDDTILKSSIKKKNLSPIWQEDFEFEVEDAEASVTLTVWDHDLASGNDHMGQVVVPLKTLSDRAAHRDWHPLESEDGGPGTGKVEVVFRLFHDPKRVKPKPPRPEEKSMERARQMSRTAPPAPMGMLDGIVDSNERAEKLAQVLRSRGSTDDEKIEAANFVRQLSYDDHDAFAFVKAGVIGHLIPMYRFDPDEAKAAAASALAVLARVRRRPSHDRGSDGGPVARPAVTRRYNKTGLKIIVEEKLIGHLTETMRISSDQDVPGRRSFRSGAPRAGDDDTPP